MVFRILLFQIMLCYLYEESVEIFKFCKTKIHSAFHQSCWQAQLNLSFGSIRCISKPIKPGELEKQLGILPSCLEILMWTVDFIPKIIMLLKGTINEHMTYHRMGRKVQLISPNGQELNSYMKAKGQHFLFFHFPSFPTLPNHTKDNFC